MKHPVFCYDVNMELPLKCVSDKFKIRAVFLAAENLSMLAIHEWLQNVYGINIMPEHTVCSWVHRFHEKWENIHDDGRSG